MTTWGEQRGRKIGEALDDIRGKSALLDNLMAWMEGAEATLVTQEKQPLPDNVPIIEQLLHDHQVMKGASVVAFYCSY